MTWQPDHRMADDPMIDETLPDEGLPDEGLSAEPLPAEPLPAEPLPAEPLPALPLPAEAMTDEPMTGAWAMDSDDPDLVVVHSGTEFSNATDDSNAIDDGDGGMATESVAGGGLSDQWHDIQAMFVDDPQRSVERAAQETEAAVSALVESLRRRQAALVSSGSSSDPSDTEQLRAALRAYRFFCERLTGLEEQLPRSGAMAL